VGEPELVAEVARVLGALGRASLLDLAAGTGKLTRMFAPTRTVLTAVEPVAAMRAKLAEACPRVPCLEGTAEEIPIADDSIDLVTCAQAFHWFDMAKALPEIARVAVPGGGLALVWNVRDESVEWVRQLSEIIGWHHRSIPHYGSTDWNEVIGQSGLFEPLEKRELRNEQEMTVERLVDRVASISYVAAMEPEERDPILARVRELVKDFDAPFVLPYRTDLYWTRSKPKRRRPQ